jgi:rod shape-determining protein MreC
VLQAGLNHAIVSSVINTGSATGIKVSRTGDIGVVEGDGELCMQGVCRVSFIENNTGLIIGDILETSGSGGIYPPGYIVGSIKEVKTDNTGKLNYAIVEPAVDFANLREVLVIRK